MKVETSASLTVGVGGDNIIDFHATAKYYCKTHNRRTIRQSHSQRVSKEPVTVPNNRATHKNLVLHMLPNSGHMIRVNQI